MKLAVEDYYVDESLFEGFDDDYDPNTQELEMLSGDVNETINYVHTHISDHLSRLADTTDSIITSSRFSRR